MLRAEAEAEARAIQGVATEAVGLEAEAMGDVAVMSKYLCLISVSSPFCNAPSHVSRCAFNLLNSRFFIPHPTFLDVLMGRNCSAHARRRI